MTDYGTIKIPTDAYEKHNEYRKQLGLTWAEYIEGEAPDAESVGAPNTEEVIEQLKDIQVTLEATEVNRIADEIEARLR